MIHYRVRLLSRWMVLLLLTALSGCESAPPAPPAVVDGTTVAVYGASLRAWMVPADTVSASPEVSPSMPPSQALVVDIGVRVERAARPPTFTLAWRDGRAIETTVSFDVVQDDGVVDIMPALGNDDATCAAYPARRARASGYHSLFASSLPPGGYMRGWAIFRVSNALMRAHTAQTLLNDIDLVITPSSTSAAAEAVRLPLTTQHAPLADSVAWAPSATAEAHPFRITAAVVDRQAPQVTTVPVDPCVPTQRITVKLQNTAAEEQIIPTAWLIRDGDGRLTRPVRIAPAPFVVGPGEMRSFTLDVPILENTAISALLVQPPGLDPTVPWAVMAVTEAASSAGR